MKLKFNIALFAALALGLASCSDDEYKGIAQVTPSEPTMPADGITAVDALASGSSVNLNDGAARLVNVTKLEDFPAGSELQVVMKVASTQDMADAQNVVLVTTDGVDGAVKSCNAPQADFNAALQKLFGKNPSPKTVYVNYTAYAVDGSSSVLLGAVGAAQSLVVTPMDLGYVVEDEYYILNTVDGKTYKMVQADATKDPYDAPVFDGIITVDENGFAWKIVPASALNSLSDASKLYGDAEPELTATEGALALGAEAGEIEETGPYQFSINMEELTFTYKAAYNALYVVGNGQSWNPSTPAQMTTKDYIKYGGFVPVDGEFKIITSYGAWTEPQIGSCTFEADPDTGGNPGGYVATAKFEQGQANNMGGLPKGLWAMVFMMDTKEIKASPVTSLEFIGDATGGWGDGDVQALTAQEVNGVATSWTGTITFSGNGEYKIRANHGWAFSLGGSADQLIWDAGNIPSPAAGKYIVTLNLNDPVTHLDMQKVD
ncbi:MAG: hypothetical protein NC127_03875 [Muribaculum sp.]|nr:hypothetical protein [Muribaculum sp.]